MTLVPTVADFVVETRVRLLAGSAVMDPRTVGMEGVVGAYNDDMPGGVQDCYVPVVLDAVPGFTYLIEPEYLEVVVR